MTGLTYHDLAADVAGVIDALDIAPAILLGHAFGNRIARTVAADTPEHLRGVILVAAGGKVGPRPEAARALSQRTADPLDRMKWMVGSPENASSVWDRLKPSHAPAATAAQAAAGRATPLED
jgi:pimeloyl-ACP methyl ester carboxylesterase